jgi:RNA polymerase sigma-70 factor, ECF subfamily
LSRWFRHCARYAPALLQDHDLADDLVQDCLERVISRWDQRRRSDDTRQWVFAIAHNLAMDCLRQQARRGAHVPIDGVPEAQMAANSCATVAWTLSPARIW